MVSIGDTCISIYTSEERTFAEELPVKEGEHLSVVNFSVCGEWAWCLNIAGLEGFVRFNHLQPLPQAASSPRNTSNQAWAIVNYGDDDTANAISQGNSPLGVYEGETEPITHYRILESINSSNSQQLTVREGEIVISRSSPVTGDQLWVQSCRLVNCKGFVPKAVTCVASELDVKPWFLGKICRYDAENLLTPTEIVDGTFLIRESETTAGFVLSHKDGVGSGSSIIRHRKITISEDGLFTAWTGFNFPTLNTLVDTHCTPAGQSLLSIPYNKIHPCEPINSYTNSLIQNIKQIDINQEEERSTESKPSISRLLKPSVSKCRKASMRQAPAKKQGSPAPPIPSRSSNLNTDIEARVTNIPFYGSPLQGKIHRPPVEIPKTFMEFKPVPETSGSINNNSHTIYNNSGETGHPANQEWHIDPQGVERLERLGAGHFGEVWKAKFKKQDSFVAIKTFNPDTMNQEEFLKEVDAMKELRHPNLVKLYGVCSEGHTISMIIAYHINGSVLDYFKKGNSLMPAQKLKIAQDVALGMKYLSGLEYIHRDLAARNVLLADDLTPRVADFGLAQMIKRGEQCGSGSSMKMPWKWTAPEALRGKNDWTSKCDVWSYGIFCWELYSNCETNPYSEIHNSSDLIIFLKQGQRLQIPDDCEMQIYLHILKSSWEMVPQHRISFARIVHFFKSQYKH